MNFLFSSQYRLKNSQDFDYLRRDSKKYNSFYFIIYSKESRLKLKNSRIGISVSKKSGNAIARNKFKRLIREAFRVSGLREKGLDLLVVVSKNNVGKTFFRDKEKMQTFKKALVEGLDKIG